MIENLRTALVAVVLIGGMVAFLSGSAHYPAFEKSVTIAHVHRGDVITCDLDK